MMKFIVLQFSSAAKSGNKPDSAADFSNSSTDSSLDNSESGRRGDVSQSVTMINQADDQFGGSSASHSRQSNESLMSLMTTTSTSGIAHSQSPMSPRNSSKQYCRSSNYSYTSSQQSLDSVGGLGHRQLYFCGNRINGSQIIRQVNNPSRAPSQASVYRLSEESGPPLPIKPLFAEDIPYVDPFVPFIGREWLFHELQEILLKPHAQESSSGLVHGAIICGAVGTGKTAILKQLAINSSFHQPSLANQTVAQIHHQGASGGSGSSADSGIERASGGSRLSLIAPGGRSHTPSILPGSDLVGANSKCQAVAQCVVAYHFCQIDSCRTCQLPEFIANLGAMLAFALPLKAYREFLASNPSVSQLLTLDQCIEDPLSSFRKAIVEPLKQLRKSGKLPNLATAKNYLILIDGLDEAEFYRPEIGESIAGFVAKYFIELPPWIKVVLSMKSSATDLIRGPSTFHKISLDALQTDEKLYLDVRDYICFRISQSTNIQANIQASPPSAPQGAPGGSTQRLVREAIASSSSIPNMAYCAVTRFVDHLTALSRGNFLYLKLTLTLIERNSLVIRSVSYKVLPVSLSEVFLLMLNLKFPSLRTFERAMPVLECCLAALNPPTAKELFEALNAGAAQQARKNDTLTPASSSTAPQAENNGSQENYCKHGPLTSEEFSEALLNCGELLVQKPDSSYVVFHPAFRDWLVKRHDGESTKFLCDLKSGHALLALRLCQMPHKLSQEKLFELGHHMLKGHIHKSIIRERNNAIAKPSTSSANNSPNESSIWIPLLPENIKDALNYRRNILWPNTKVSRLLLLAGADCDIMILNAKSNETEPLLCVATASGQPELVNLLLELGADPCTTGSAGLTALMEAARAGHIDMVQLFHQHGARVAQWDKTDRCALVHAAEAGHVTVVSFLLQCDWADEFEAANQTLGRVRRRSSDSLSASASNESASAIRLRAAQRAFVLAAGKGQTHVCRCLLDFADVSIDEPDPFSGETALSMACLSAQKETVQFLLGAGALAAYPKASGAGGGKRPTPPLIEAVTSGSWELVSSLLSRGIDVDQERGSKGQTALMAAAEHGHIGVMELLLSRDSDVNAIDVDGKSALIYACGANQLPCTSLLLERNANIDVIDRSGRTALHYAAEKAGQSLTRLLLDRGAILDSPDRSGLRPLELSIQAGNMEALACCLKKGAKLGPTTWNLAEQKVDILLMLLNKLLEDGNLLYKRNRLKDASQRYMYALKRIPTDVSAEDEAKLCEIHHTLLLNYARCKKKLHELPSAIELASKAIAIKQNSFESFYVRARCYRDNGQLEPAMADISEAVRLCPSNRDARQMMIRIRQELSREAPPSVEASQPPPLFPRRQRLEALQDKLASVSGPPEGPLPPRRQGPDPRVTLATESHVSPVLFSPISSQKSAKSGSITSSSPGKSGATIVTTPLANGSFQFDHRFGGCQATDGVSVAMTTEQILSPRGNNGGYHAVKLVSKDQEDCRSSTDSGHVPDFEERTNGASPDKIS